MGRKAGELGEESTQQAAAAAVGGHLREGLQPAREALGEKAFIPVGAELQGGAPTSEGRLSVRRLSFQWGQSSREGLQPARGGSR